MRRGKLNKTLKAELLTCQAFQELQDLYWDIQKILEREALQSPASSETLPYNL